MDDCDEGDPAAAAAAAGCVTKKDAVFNQPKVVLYLEFFLPFLLKVAGRLPGDVGGGLAGKDCGGLAGEAAGRLAGSSLLSRSLARAREGEAGCGLAGEVIPERARWRD